MLDKLKEFLKEIGEVEGKYLVSCFHQNNEWRVDYYSKEKHKIYTYHKKNGEIKVMEDEIFQKESKVLEELKIENVKIGYEEVVEMVKVGKQKLITILQVVNGKIVWNVTALTPTLELYNLKVDAESGEVLSESKENVMNFRVNPSVGG